MSETRTLQQNKALHLWLGMVAKCLNDAGLDMKTVLKPEIEIPWTQESAKTHLFKPVLEVMAEKDSTAEADTTDYDAVQKVIARHIAEKFGVQLPTWPDRYHSE